MKATTTVFFDGQFASADWEDQFTRFPSRKQLHVENVNRKIDVLSKAQEGHENKGRARQTTIVAQRSVGEDPQKHIMASLVHLNRQATFDPSVLGKVESIDFYLDLMNVDSTPGVEVQYAIVLQQDGVIFQSPPARLTGTKKWKGFISESLVAVDFLRLGKPTALSPHHRPDFSKQAPPIQFGYVLHVSGADASLKSVTSIGEWKVSVTHRTDLGLSLSQTQEFKQRLESEVLERQRLERAIIEQRLRAEQELREIKLKAEEEINSLRMSLPIVERDSKASSHARTPGGKSLNGAGLGRTEDLSHLLDAGSSGDVSRYCVEDKYVSIVQAAQNRLQEVDSRRKAERQRKEKLEEEREDMRRTIELERQGREEAERKWAEQYEEANKSADEEKRRLDEELASYRRRIFTLEQELLGECKSKEQREEELCRARDEAAAKHEEVEDLQANIRDALDTLAKREAEHAHEKRMEECRAAELERQIKEMDEMLRNISLQIAALEHEKEDLQDQVDKLQDQIERYERAWREACEKKEREAKEALEAAETRLQAEVGAWRERIGKCRIEHAQEKEFLQQQFAEEKASAEDALKKVSDAHERKEDAWKRTAKELNKKLKHCTQKLSDAEEEIESRERAMMEAVNGLEEKLKDAHREVALRDEVAEGLQRNKSAVEQQLRATIEQLDSELHNLHEEAKKQRETWEQEKWQLELERAEAKREADLAMQRMLDESKDALDQERQRSEAHADSLSDMTARFEHAQHQITTLEATVQQLQQQMAERDATERKLAADVALLTEHADNERRARMDLEQAVSNAEEGADKLNLRLDAEIRRNRELQQTLATVSAERASLVEKVEAEREGKKQATQELEALKDNYDLEKTLREKIALELFAEIDARKEGEKRQASIISALNEHMKKQAEAIVQLDLALRQEQADRMQLEEQVDAEMVARVKAEEALRKLDEIFKNASKEEDAEWELVTDEERKVRQ